jgi:hypothetical protein
LTLTSLTCAKDGRFLIMLISHIRHSEFCRNMVRGSLQRVCIAGCYFWRDSELPACKHCKVRYNPVIASSSGIIICLSYRFLVNLDILNCSSLWKLGQ